MMPGASGPMRGMRGNVRGRGGRGGNFTKKNLQNPNITELLK